MLTLKDIGCKPMIGQKIGQSGHKVDFGYHEMYCRMYYMSTEWHRHALLQGPAIRLPLLDARAAVVASWCGVALEPKHHKFLLGLTL